MPFEPVAEHRCDVLVVGGGPAGIAAATASARGGADTVLIENTCCLGGLGTSGLVPAFAPFNYNERDGKPYLRGIPWEVVERLDAANGLYGLGKDRWWKLFDKEIAKRVFESMVLEVGVHLRYFTFFHTVETTGQLVKRALTVSKGGLEAWNAEVFVDASGDADLAAASGAPILMGDAATDRMPPTYCFTVTGVDRALLGDTRQVNEAMKRGKVEGRLRNPDDHRGEKDIFGPEAMIFNYNHIYGIDCLNADDLTHGVVEGREIAFELLDYLRETVPGFTKANISSTGILLGVRETRRIRGEFVLEKDAYFESRRHEDDICVYDYALDLHAARATKDSQDEYYDIYYDKRTRPGECYGIPFRSLLPRDIDNVVVAGRCISCDRPMLGSVRQMPSSMAMGQAAGTAAAIALKHGCRLREIPIADLQDRLRRNGAHIP
jgi:hypothetical protein